MLAAVRPRDDDAYELDEAVAAPVRQEVAALCARFPIPGYSAEPPRTPVASIDTGRIPVVNAATDPLALPAETPA